MKIAIFDTHAFEKEIFIKTNLKYLHQLSFIESRLNSQTAEQCAGFNGVCSFVNDKLDADTLEILKKQGVKIIALRCAGFNHVDLKSALDLQMPVVRVPEYSPYAVAEHTLALLLTLNRKIHRAHARVREFNFSLDGLVGFDLHGKTIGVIGTGRIGRVLIKILNGFGCRVLAFDKYPHPDILNRGSAEYCELETIYKNSDVISLNLPLTPETHHWINEKALSLMRPHVFIINTGRGGLINTAALLQALKNHKIGGAGLDVYEEEEAVFFKDHSDTGIDDDALARLLTYPNVVVTSHQAFLTQEALTQIAETTLSNLHQFEKTGEFNHSVYEVTRAGSR
ncbi:MAG: 2-hydroxyacid dehydrogenase [Bdellovibrionales bacterium]